MEEATDRLAKVTDRLEEAIDRYDKATDRCHQRGDHALWGWSEPSAMLELARA